MLIIILVIFLWFLLIFLPDSTSTLNQIIQIVGGIIVIAYFGIALVVLIVNTIKSSPDDRKNLGLNLMVIGTVIGILPFFIYAIIELFVQNLNKFAVSDYIFIAFVAIPVFFSLALMRLEKQKVNN